MTVVVVGSVNWDLVAVGERTPAPGETRMMAHFSEHHGGKGANQASVAAALGALVHLVGATGTDDRGDAARADLAARSIHLEGLLSVDVHTGVAMILVDGEGENSVAVVPGANAMVTDQHVDAALSAIEQDDVVVVASLEVPIAAVEAAARTAQYRGWPFILNPAPARPLPRSLVAASSVITPNESELAMLGGVPVLLEAGAGAVVVTRGGDGAELSVPGSQSLSFPAYPAQVVDTTGAGDAFTAGLAVALSRGRPLDEAVAWAVAVGAIATEGLGARGSLPTTEQVTTRLTWSGMEAPSDGEQRSL